MNFLDFTNKHVLVTGGSSGIGNGIARAFRDASAQVTITGTRAASTYDTDIREMEFLQADLGDDTAVQQVADQVGPIDILINNAGMVAYKRKEFQTETFRRVIDVNLTSMMTLSELLRPRLAEATGAIINIASLTSFFASSGNPAYGASKKLLSFN